MKKIKIIGIGMGDAASMTVAAANWIRECDLLIGASRMVRAAAAICGGDRAEYVTAYLPKEVWGAIRQSETEKIAVLMSGDIGFYSGARALREEMAKDPEFCAAEGNFSETAKACGIRKTEDGCEYEISWIPGISSMAYFCSLVGIPYEDVCAISIHGRRGPYIRQIAVCEKTFLLTDGDLPGLGRKLNSYGLGNVTVWVGMNLAAPEQRICRLTVEELEKFPKEDCCPLTVCLILNPTPEKWRSPWRRDEEFFRDGKTPMTKEEIRCMILGKLQPQNRDVIYDIGGGSGSVSVACAIAASGGTVYSVECDPDAAKLLDENRRRFACDNIEIIAGRAPEALRGLPAPDRVFIGGSGGDLAGILGELENIAGPAKGGTALPDFDETGGRPGTQVMQNPDCGKTGREAAGRGIRVVISSITLETSAAVSSYISTSAHVKNPEVCQAAVAKSKKAGGSTLMMGRNPVMIFSFDLVG